MRTRQQCLIRNGLIRTLRGGAPAARRWAEVSEFLPWFLPSYPPRSRSRESDRVMARVSKASHMAVLTKATCRLMALRSTPACLQLYKWNSCLSDALDTRNPASTVCSPLCCCAHGKSVSERCVTMKRLILMFVATALAACAGPDQGPSEPTAGPATQPVASSSGDVAPRSVAQSYKAEALDEVVCRRERATGSRITSSVCHTRREWARIEAEAKELMRDVQTKPVPNPPPPGG